MFDEQTLSHQKTGQLKYLPWQATAARQHRIMKQNSRNIFRDNFNKTLKQLVDSVDDVAHRVVGPVITTLYWILVKERIQG